MKKEMNEYKKAYVERLKKGYWLDKYLYMSGAMKVVEVSRAFPTSKPKYSYKLRFLHPISFLLFFLYIAVSGINGDTKDDLKKGYTWW